MAILTKERLNGYGPFVDFYERRPNGDTAHLGAWADSLIDVCCAITNQYLPFDPYFNGELDRRQMRILARDLYSWCSHLSFCRLDALDLEPLIDLYISNPPVDHPIYERATESLRTDLIDTVSFLASSIVLALANGNRLVIDGI